MSNKKNVVNPEIAIARRGIPVDSENVTTSDITSDGTEKTDSLPASMSHLDGSTEKVGDDSSDIDLTSESLSDAMIDSSDHAGIGYSYDDSSENNNDSDPKDDLVECTFSYNENESLYFECSINYIKYRFRRGIPVKVPKAVYDFYIYLNRDKINADAIKNSLAYKEK